MIFVSGGINHDFNDITKQAYIYTVMESLATPGSLPVPDDSRMMIDQAAHVTPPPGFACVGCSTATHLGNSDRV